MKKLIKILQREVHTSQKQVLTKCKQIVSIISLI